MTYLGDLKTHLDVNSGTTSSPPNPGGAGVGLNGFGRPIVEDWSQRLLTSVYGLWEVVAGKSKGGESGAHTGPVSP